MRQLSPVRIAIAVLAGLLACAHATAGPSRLNRLVEQWEDGRPVFGTFAFARDAGAAQYYAASPFDFVIVDLEHAPADFGELRTFLQFLLDRGSVLRKGSLQPDVVPLVRIPASGGEPSAWMVKQALDLGVYGLVAPQISSQGQANALVSSARYPQREGVPDAQPAGSRGYGPAFAARYWGLPIGEYVERADTWPLDPQGELAVIAMIESRDAVAQLRAMLAAPRGIAAVFVGPGDLAASLGHPGEGGHPDTEAAVREVLAVSRELGVPCGITVSVADIEKRVKEGFSFLVIGGTPAQAEEALRLGRAAAEQP